MTDVRVPVTIDYMEQPHQRHMDTDTSCSSVRN